jgi:hypothetical protein
VLEPEAQEDTSKLSLGVPENLAGKSLTDLTPDQQEEIIARAKAIMSFTVTTPGEAQLSAMSQALLETTQGQAMTPSEFDATLAALKAKEEQDASKPETSATDDALSADMTSVLGIKSGTGNHGENGPADFPQTRADWDSILVAYRNNVYYVKAPRG